MYHFSGTNIENIQTDFKETVENGKKIIFPAGQTIMTIILYTVRIYIIIFVF